MIQVSGTNDRDDTHKLSAAALARLDAHDRATAHLRDRERDSPRDGSRPA